MKISDRIKARRIELGLTQDELASRMGYKGKSSINKIEMGKQDLPQKKIVAIASALETTPEYIMGWDDLPNSSSNIPSLYLSEEESEIIQAYRSANGGIKSAVSKLLDVDLIAARKREDYNDDDV